MEVHQPSEKDRKLFRWARLAAPAVVFIVAVFAMAIIVYALKP